MEEVRQFITSVISLNDENLTRLIDTLLELGVTNINDFVDVQVGDLSPAILPVVQGRKLIRTVNALLTTEVPLPEAVISTPPSNLGSVRLTVSSASRPVPLTPVPLTPVPLTPLMSCVAEANLAANWHSLFDINQSISSMLTVDKQLITQDAAKCLLDGAKLTSSQRNEIVRIVTDDILRICKRPKRLHVSVIAEMLVCKYTQLRDECDGVVIGCGYSSLRNQIECRVSYLNKPLSARKRASVAKRLVLDNDENQSKTMVVRDGYGCVDFLPTEMPVAETDETLNNKHNKLKDMHASGRWNDVEVTLLMDATYILQRQDLVGSSALLVKQIQDNWPFLMQPKWMVSHLCRLLGFNIIEKLEAGLLSKKETLVSYFRTKARLMKDIRQQLTVFEAEDSAMQPVISLIPLLLTYFGESHRLLLISYEIIPDTRSDAEFAALPTTPCLLFQGCELHKATVFRLVVDGIIVCSAIESPVAAIALLFGTFFVFNIQYPIDASATLEFIQRVFLNINPRSGTKIAKLRGKKSRSGVHEKVLSLIREMSVNEVLAD